MPNDTTRSPAQSGSTRRDFLKTSLTAGALAGTMAAAPRAFSAPRRKPPNFLFLVCDQLGLDAISAHGCPDVHTPNLDRLVERGLTFTQSHSTSPVCSPARSSMFTGRMATETGVITNDRPIHPRVPTMGHWFREHGYETVYTGKWHLPYGYQVDVPGFTTLPCGGGQGDLADSIVSRSSETYLKTRSSRQPFVLVSSLMQPHDICYWAIQDKELVPPGLPFERLADSLPPLPPNHTARPKAPEYLDNIKYTRYSEEQWRYYLYIYYRQVEMLDADVGRILDGLEDAGLEEDTVVCFTSDHGDGRGRHMHVQKWYPYEESVKVPFIMSCPERMESGVRDETSLLSGIDILPTFCDFAGLDAPEGTTGASVRPLCEGRPNAPWRDYVVADTHVIGRMVRTDRWKFVTYEDDPVEQLFDMDNDPWETQNLAGEDQYASIIEDHRQMLTEWESRLDKVDPTSRPNR